MAEYSGSCHCRAVQFRFTAPLQLTVWRCNCSVCHMRQNHHIIVPEANLTIDAGQDLLTQYTFGTHTAKHMFCKVCGISPFYIPRSNPNGYGVTVYCIDTSPAAEIIWRNFDGQNWESQYATSDISDFSKSDTGSIQNQQLQKVVLVNGFIFLFIW